jgi:predicted nucleic acid-binding protein
MGVERQVPRIVRRIGSVTVPLPTGRSCFVDTSAFFAATVDGDANYREAVDAFARLIMGQFVVLTSNFIVAETHALFLRREGRYAALRFLQSLTASGLLVERVSGDDELVARANIEQYEDKDFSYTDATSFALVRRLAIASALSFDQHFRQFGLPMP